MLKNQFGCWNSFRYLNQTIDRIDTAAKTRAGGTAQDQCGLVTPWKTKKDSMWDNKEKQQLLNATTGTCVWHQQEADRKQGRDRFCLNSDNSTYCGWASSSVRYACKRATMEEWVQCNVLKCTILPGYEIGYQPNICEKQKESFEVSELVCTGAASCK